MKLVDQKDFEQWASEQGFSTDKDSNGSYRVATTDAAWGGWLAAVQTERERCADAIDNLVLDHPGQANKTAMQCAQAIRDLE